MVGYSLHMLHHVARTLQQLRIYRVTAEMMGRHLRRSLTATRIGPGEGGVTAMHSILDPGQYYPSHLYTDL